MFRRLENSCCSLWCPLLFFFAKQAAKNCIIRISEASNEDCGTEMQRSSTASWPKQPNLGSIASEGGPWVYSSQRSWKSCVGPPSLHTRGLQLEPRGQVVSLKFFRHVLMFLQLAHRDNVFLIEMPKFPHTAQFHLHDG